VVHFSVLGAESNVALGTLTIELVTGLSGAPGTGLRCQIGAGNSRCTGSGSTAIAIGDFISIAVSGGLLAENLAIGWSCAA
jgi:hypothetical protein